MFVNSNIIEYRLDICSKCEFYEKTLKMCKICNCFMIAKVRLEYTQCPILKWTDTITKPTQ